jgi:exoribonuclease R
MRRPQPRVGLERDTYLSGFARLRRELRIPAEHQPDTLAEAEAVVQRGPQLPPDPGASAVADRTDIAFVAVDPPGSKDLDQAYHAERSANGYRVHYAIADVASFVTPGGALDSESRSRGVTFYSPDTRCSLYPEILSEGVASLLEGVERPALLWTMDLDSHGALVQAHIERATVRVRAAVSYQWVQDHIDAGTAEEPLALLAEIGALRQQLEADRGGVSLNLPGQEVVATDTGGYQLLYDKSLPVEGWNAQISLLTGMAAASLMVDAGTGMLRTLPPAEQGVVEDLRERATILGVPWPAGEGYAAFIRSLDPTNLTHLALLNQSTGVLRGAGYLAFVNERPEHAGHGAIAAEYAHVTAPLRRMADRYVNEILLAICADAALPDWAVTALPELPSELDRARSRERNLERAIVDWVEALTLSNRLGEHFDAVAVRRFDDGDVLAQIMHPAIVARVGDTGANVGDLLDLELASAEPQQRKVTFSGSVARPS